MTSREQTEIIDSTKGSDNISGCQPGKCFQSPRGTPCKETAMAAMRRANSHAPVDGWELNGLPPKGVQFVRIFRIELFQDPWRPPRSATVVAARRKRHNDECDGHWQALIYPFDAAYDGCPPRLWPIEAIAIEHLQALT